MIRLLPLLLAACDRSTITATCNNPMTPWPANNAGDVFRETEIAVRFTQGIEADPVFTLDDEDGPVAGAVVSDPADVLRLVFVPDAPLATRTRHRATLTWSCGTTSWEFTTSDVGEPVGTPSPATYLLDLADAAFDPVGLEGMLYYGEGWPAPLLLAIAPDDVGVLGLLASTTAGDVQDVCATTATFAADYDDPKLTATGIDLWLRDATFEGTLSPDSSRMQGVRLAGEIDARELFGTPYGCDFLYSLETQCTACSDGSGRYCFSLTASDVPTWRVERDVVPRTAEDVAADCPAY